MLKDIPAAAWIAALEAFPQNLCAGLAVGLIPQAPPQQRPRAEEVFDVKQHPVGGD